MADLTPKQQKFAQAYVETGNASEAYRRAYNAENMGQPSIAVEACNLLSEPKIALMVQSLKEELREHLKITVDDLIQELEDARQVARGGEKPQVAAMVAAIMGKAKILGLEAPQKIDHTSSDGTMSPVSTSDAVLAALARKHADT